MGGLTGSMLLVSLQMGNCIAGPRDHVPEDHIEAQSSPCSRIATIELQHITDGLKALAFHVFSE